MKGIRKFLLFCAFAALFIIRIFVEFSWISSLALAGLFLSILDILGHVWNDNISDIIKRHKLYLLFIIFNYSYRSYPHCIDNSKYSHAYPLVE